MTVQHIVLVLRCKSGSDNHIYFRTPYPLEPSETIALGDIEGMRDYGVYDNTIGLNFGEGFTWREIAPQAILVLADAFRVDVTELKLEAHPGSVYKEDDMSWIIQAARELRKPKKAPRTPLYPFALTADDVRPGVPFLRYNLRQGLKSEDIFSSEPVRDPDGASDEPDLLVYTHGAPRYGVYLCDAGLTRYEAHARRPGGWNSVNFSVANTPGARRQFVQWLLSRNESVATNAAKELVGRYPGDYIKTSVVVERGIVIARVTYFI